MQLTSQNVEQIFVDCLADNEEELKSILVFEGVANKFALVTTKVEQHKAEIASLLSQLPHAFREKSGGGWSFLQACEDANGRQWTDLHLRMEQLFVLGEAAGLANCLLPRKMWGLFPHGMPYYMVTNEAIELAEQQK